MFKVLIVDDEEAAREGMRKALQREGDYEIHAAESLDAANEQINKHKRFDVILVDLWLPEGEWSGGEIVRRFADKSTITIVVTAHATTDNCAALIRAGAYDYIDKTKGDPYDRLLKAIRDGLEQRARPKPELNALWVSDNLPTLLDEYAGKYIAVLDQEVIAEGPTEQELRKKLEADFPKQDPTVISIPAIDERSRIG